MHAWRISTCCSIQGEVLSCLVAHIGITSNACSQESIRAVHTGLQFYQPVRRRSFGLPRVVKKKHVSLPLC